MASGESNLRKNASIFLAATAYTCYNFYLRHRFLSSHAPTAQKKETVSFVRACFSFLLSVCMRARVTSHFICFSFAATSNLTACIPSLPFVFRSRSRCRNFPSATCPASRYTSRYNTVHHILQPQTQTQFLQFLNQHPTILQNIRHPVTLPLQSQRHCFRSPVSNPRPAQCRRKTPNFKP